MLIIILPFPILQRLQLNLRKKVENEQTREFAKLWANNTASASRLRHIRHGLLPHSREYPSFTGELTAGRLTRIRSKRSESAP